MSSCCEKFGSCLKLKVVPEFDFLHPNSIYKTKKYTKQSKCGIILSFLFILTFVVLFFYEKDHSKSNPAISYSQDFIRKREWVGKKITLGFNVSDEWKNDVNFTLYDTNNEIINLKKCNEELEESENATYDCVIDYIIIKNSDSTHTLKLHLNLTKNISEEKRIPFLFL